MRLRDKKLLILRLLGQESDPITLSALLQKLPPEFKERSVRRWLNELMQEGLVTKTGKKRASTYKIAILAEQQKANISSCFGSKSLETLQYVKKPLFERMPKAYNDEWFDSYIPNQTFLFAESIRNQLYEAGMRASNNEEAGTYARQIFNRLLIDLSYNSSRLEGNTYSKLDTEQLLLRGTTPTGKLDQEKVMILNHKEAIRYLVDNANRLLVNEQTIFTLHYLLSDGLIESEYSGKVRDYWVRISGSTYIPFEDKHRLKAQLQKIITKAATIQNPFEQSLFLLIHISYLQPFIDVNKRTARLAANIPLILGNLVPLSFNDIEKDDYISAMIAIYELQDVHPITDLYAFSYMRTCAAYTSTVKSLGFNEIRVKYRQQRRALMSEILSHCLQGNAMNQLIEKRAKENIPDSDRQAFIQDVKDELKQMDESRLVGLGITPEQLHQWKLNS